MTMNLSKLQDSGGQRSLVRSSPWSHKELDTTQQLNSNNKYLIVMHHVPRNMLGIQDIIRNKDDWFYVFIKSKFCVWNFDFKCVNLVEKADTT